ncbi:mitochondrial inner membrane protein Mitofilin, partial [Phakopsora pachyrhizi]
LYSAEADATTGAGPAKKGLFRSVVLPTALLSGVFYGAGIYASLQNEKIREMFVDQVPLGESLIGYCEDSNLELVGIISKRTIEITAAIFSSAKQALGGKKSRIEPEEQRQRQQVNDESPIEKIKAKTEAAVKRGKEDDSAKTTAVIESKPVPEPETILPILIKQPEETLTNKPPTETATLSGLPPYPGEIPIGHEPPPGYLGSSPRPRDPSVGPAPEPPVLPLLAPTINHLSASEPILGQLASTIDSLSGFLREYPEVLVKGKDPSGQNASRVLTEAESELKKLAERLEMIKAQEHEQLQRQLESQSKKYGKMLLDAEKELHQRLDRQEEDWKDTYELERSRLVQAFEAKLTRELEVQEELINERLRQEVLARGLEMQRRWVRQIKSQVELEREGRWGKLAELESCIKELGRLTVDNEEYLDENLRLNQLWNAIRSISTSAFDSPLKNSIVNEARALQRLCFSHSKSNSSAKETEPEEDLLSKAMESVSEITIETGVQPLPSLTVWFKDSVAPRIKSASFLPQDGGFISYLFSHYISVFLFSRFHSHDGDDPVSVINRVSAHLDAKDLDMATRELNSLTGWPKVLAKDWIDAARRHLELQQAIQVIEAEAKFQSLLLQ